LLIGGLVALVTGKVSLTKNLVVHGAMARVVGAILMLPIPLALGCGILLGVVMAAQGGKSMDDIRIYAAILDVGITVGCILLAVIVAAMSPKSKPAKKRRPDDDYDDNRDPLRSPRDRDQDRELDRDRWSPQPGKETGFRDSPDDDLPRRRSTRDED